MNVVQGRWYRCRNAACAGQARSKVLASGALALILAGAVPAGATVQQPAALAFEGVTVVDVREGRLLPNQTIVVAGTRIQAVGAVGQVAVPAGARVAKAHGTYVIPGLWDMHTHALELGRQWYPAFLAHGVTGIREMSTPVLDSVHQWRREIAAGTLAGPRVFTPGPGLETPDAAARFNAARPLPLLLAVATPADAGRLVDSLKRAGVDFIKPHGQFSREVHFALAAAARRAGLSFAGHLPKSVTPAEASDSGQRSIEHILSCGSAARKAGDTVAARAECRALAEQFRRNGTWFAPSQPIEAVCRLLETPSHCTEQRTQYGEQARVPEKPRQAKTLLPFEQFAGPVGRSLEAWAMWHTRDSQKDHYQRLRAAGIRFLAGTDAAPLAMFGGMSMPGSSLHDELWRLVRYGLTPLEALQAATLNPAEYFQATDSLGTVAPGKLADLVFLDADPLTDIYNTRRVRAVVANGRFYDRDALDALLDARGAGSSSAGRKP